MYDKFIDVAEIMRKIKSEVIPEDTFVTEFNGQASQGLSTFVNEINRIHSFLINTRGDMDFHKRIGYSIPRFDRFPWPIRKIFVLIARIVAKTTRFITREQNVVNEDISASLKAIVESERQIVKALSYMDTLYQKVELENKRKYMNSSVDDNLYLRFEDKFRGNSDEIKSRLSYYINNYILRNVNKEDDKIIIDIGCGRGEWLDILQQNGFSAIGVDNNEIMVKLCQEKGFEAVCEDAIKYLGRLDEKSVKLLTCFQVVEHLHFDQLNGLLKEISRVLDDNGMLIIETPNAHNLEVGSHNFYIDPTHKRPVHPSLLEFLAQEKGINETEIVYWKSEEIDQWWNSVIAEDGTDIFDSPAFRTIASSIKRVLYNSPDYALVGIKK